MALTDREKDQIISTLDTLDDVTKIIILASIDSFAKWLETVLHEIYSKIKHALSKLWTWLCQQFS